MSICIWSISNSYAEENSFLKFGVIRANVAHYLSDNRWLVYYNPKAEIQEGESAKTEVVGCDAEGSIFRVRGKMRQDAENFLLLESYENPSVAFSTKDGYFYIWNPGDGLDPFEYPMTMRDYEKIMNKFELYPLLKNSKDGSVKFHVLGKNPEFYDRALLLPRPQSILNLTNPTARRLKIGMFLKGVPNNSQCLVESVVNDSAAGAAGIRADDVIMNLAVNGTDVKMNEFFPLPDDKNIRLLSLKIVRRSSNNIILVKNIDVLPPSMLESLLFK